MVLNPALYTVLQKRYGEVRVTNVGLHRMERETSAGRDVVQRGEHYTICCPICGDTKFRLSLSYLWLKREPLSVGRNVTLAHCYNENCDVANASFYGPILQEVEACEIGLVPTCVPEYLTRTDSGIRVQAAAIRLPSDFIRIDELPADHAALTFVRNKYPFYDPKWLAEKYQVGYSRGDDPIYRIAGDRIIFPIYKDHKIYAWQGRTVIDATPRWYLPSGFVKCFYNSDSILPCDVPVLAEGIPATIACGANGIGIFGNSLDTGRAKELASRWSSVVVATDPETFVPDNRPQIRKKGQILAKNLETVLTAAGLRVFMLRYPREVLEIAERKNNSLDDVAVPDPADLGPEVMSRLIKETLSGG